MATDRLNSTTAGTYKIIGLVFKHFNFSCHLTNCFRLKRGGKPSFQIPVCAIERKMAWAENTYLLRKGKYHCTTDLLFDWLGFSCFAYVELDRDLQVWLNPNQSNSEPFSDTSPYKVSECSLVTANETPSFTDCAKSRPLCASFTDGFG